MVKAPGVNPKDEILLLPKGGLKNNLTEQKKVNSIYTTFWAA
jgi:hypothetical protein